MAKESAEGMHVAASFLSSVPATSVSIGTADRFDSRLENAKVRALSDSSIPMVGKARLKVSIHTYGWEGPFESIGCDYLPRIVEPGCAQSITINSKFAYIVANR
jgi:hypothetical protein